MLGGSERSYVIQAHSHAATIEFHGSRSKPWQLPQAMLCLRREGRAAAAPAAGPCNPALFETVELAGVLIEWPNGIGIRATQGLGDAGLEIQITSLPPVAPGEVPFSIDGHPVRVNSRLVIAGPDWRAGGALVFSGYMILGTLPGGVLSDHLIDGNFEVRETLSTGSPKTVMRGDFFTGDEIRLVGPSPEDRVPVTGFLSPARDEGTGFTVVGYSGLADSSMEIRRLGAEPSIIRPSWPDRALNDPLILGLSVLLVLAVTLLDLPAKIRVLMYGGN